MHRCRERGKVSKVRGLSPTPASSKSLTILATDEVGARDLLIRTGVNGYIFEPGNVEGLAQLMLHLGG